MNGKVGGRGGKLTPAAPSNTIIQNSNTQREENAFEMAAKKSVQFRSEYIHTFPFCRIDRAPISRYVCVRNGDGIRDEFSMLKLFCNCILKGDYVTKIVYRDIHSPWKKN